MLMLLICLSKYHVKNLDNFTKLFFGFSNFQKVYLAIKLKGCDEDMNAMHLLYNEFWRIY